MSKKYLKILCSFGGRSEANCNDVTDDDDVTLIAMMSLMVTALLTAMTLLMNASLLAMSEIA